MKKPKTKWCYLEKTEEGGMNQYFLMAVLPSDCWWVLCLPWCPPCEKIPPGARNQMFLQQELTLYGQQCEVWVCLPLCLSLCLSLCFSLSVSFSLLLSLSLWLGLCKGIKNSRGIKSPFLSVLVLGVYPTLTLNLWSLSLCFSCSDITVVCPHTLQFVIR